MNNKPTIIDPAGKATKIVLWMHGLGADSNDFVSIIPELCLPENHGIRFIFPQAPQIAVTVNAGMVMPAWYDILDMENSERHLDYQGMKKSCETIIQLMEQQHQIGIAWSDMVLAGFSQGGVIAYGSAVFCKKELAGIMCLSTYSPFTQAQKLTNNFSAFVGHGRQDPVVPYPMGERCAQQLIQSGAQVEFHAYQMEHSLCQQEITHIRNWLINTLEKT